MSQKTIWEKEYKTLGGVPTTTREIASQAVLELMGYLRNEKTEAGKRVLDIGAGAGRNAVYLAQQVYEVTAIDFIQQVLDKLAQKAKELKIESSVKTVNCSFAGKLPFENNSFDIAIDIVSSISLNLREIKTLESEVRRVVNKGGLFLTYVHSRDDGYLCGRSDKQGFCKVTESGLVEHSWTEEELKKLYTKWEILEMKKIEKQDTFYGETYTRRIWWMLLRNKK